jgi:hypothetical protein
VHWQQKAQSLNFKSKTHEAQLEDPKAKKAEEGHLGEGEVTKSTSGMKSGKPSQNGKEELRKAQNQKNSQNSPWNKLP